MDHRERRAGNEQMAEDIGYIKGLVEGLAGPEGRVTKIEKAQTRQWWYSTAIAPLLYVAKAIVHKLGVSL